MSRVIVTGAAGRLGRSVVAGLVGEGRDVVAIDRVSSSAFERDGVTQITADLTDADAAREAFLSARAETVVHLAAVAVPFSAPEHRIIRTNATMAVAVTGAAVEAGVRRLIAASSPTVFGYGAPTGWRPDRLPLDESSPVAPWHAYALSKRVVEDALSMTVRHHGDRMRVAAFRPCYVIAPEEWRGAPTQQGHTVRARLDDPALAAPSLFNYLDARDAAAFVARLIDALPEIANDELFVVGADDALAREPLADLLPRFHPDTAEASTALTGTAPAFSSAKARRLLGWTPRRHWREALDDGHGA